MEFGHVAGHELLYEGYVFGVDGFDLFLKVVADDSDSFFDDFFVFHAGGSIEFVEDFADIFFLFELVGLGDHLVLFFEDFFVFLGETFLELVLFPLWH